MCGCNENASKKADRFSTPVYGQASPPVIIGGPTGDYKVLADITSARWVEYRVLALAFSNSGACVISGGRKPIALDYSGGNTLNDDSHGYGEPYVAGSSGSVSGSKEWIRVTHSEKRVFARIDTNGTIFIALQFRPCLLEIIPGPAETVHPDHAHKMNEARAGRINDSLKELKIPGYAEEQNKGAKD
jgi:hypothetical protein